MAFWDDLIQFISGRGTPTEKTKSSAPAPKVQARTVSPGRVQSAPVKTPSIQGGGGGGGGGIRSMSVGAPSFAASQPEENPWDNFIRSTPQKPEEAPGIQPVKKDEKPEYNFWDDLGAYLTTPVDGNVFTSPGIAGAANRKAQADAKWEEVMGTPDRLSAGGSPLIPTNEQLTQLGRDDNVINVDGDLRPVTNSPFENVANQRAAAEADTINGREAFESSLGNLGQRGVRQLTDEEWAGLDPEEQEGIIANYALYEAALADQGAEGQADDAYNDSVLSIFGEGGGSNTYMPNTIKVLEELGYDGTTGDLDNFRTFNAIADYRDILGDSTPLAGQEGRRQVFDSLAASTAFDDEGIQASLQAGASLLDSLRNSGSFAPTVYQFSGVGNDPVSSLAAEDQDYLMTMLKGLASRDIWNRLGSEQNLNDEVTADLQAARDKYGDDVVSTFFANNITNFTNNTDFMTPEEFKTNWIGG